MTQFNHKEGCPTLKSTAVHRDDFCTCAPKEEPGKERCCMDGCGNKNCKHCGVPALQRVAEMLKDPKVIEKAAQMANEDQRKMMGMDVPQKEGWEEKFDNKFSGKSNEELLLKREVKSFIKSAIANSEQRAYDKGYEQGMLKVQKSNEHSS